MRRTPSCNTTKTDIDYATSFNDRIIAVTASQQSMLEELAGGTTVEENEKGFLKSETGVMHQPVDTCHDVMSSMANIVVVTKAEVEIMIETCTAKMQ